MVGQTLLGKLASVGSQIVLAWYLRPADMGLVGLAFAVSGLPTMLRDAGLLQILVNRHKRFHLWAGPVFWMSLALGLLTGGILAGAAPIAERIMHKPGLSGLILLLAICSPFNALATVPAARMQADIWYRFQSITSLAAALMTMALNILFAYLGFGAYSFILPFCLVNLARTAVLWLGAPEKVGWNPHIRRWRYMWSDSGALLGAGLLTMLVSQGDYLILGFLRDAGIVGIFYFAFNLSMQTLTLLSVNLGALLFPALNKLDLDRGRQMDAFLRAARLLTAITIPFCLLQAVLSDPGVHLIFKPKWYPSIPVLEVLSVAMLFRTIGLPAMSLTAAQNRLRFNLIFLTFSSVAFLGMVVIGASIGGARAAITTAIAELVFFAGSDPLYLYLLLRHNGHSLKHLLDTFATQLFCGGAAAVGATLVMHTIRSESRPAESAKLAIGTAAMVLIYLPLLRWLAADIWEQLIHRIKSLR